MAGVPPLLGFVAKEAVFTADLEAAVAGVPWAWVALVAAFLGSVLTVAYSVRLVWGAFFTRADVPATPLHHESPLIATAPAILAVASIVGAFLIPFIEPLLAAYADTLPGPHEYHLALWHGLEPALLISAAVFALGAVLVWARRRVARMQAAIVPMIDSARGYLGIVSVGRPHRRGDHDGDPAPRASRATSPSSSPCSSAGSARHPWRTRTWPDDLRLWDYPAQPFLALVMGIAAVAAATVTQRMTAVLLVSVTGYGLVLLFGMSGAPDLALTQALVETIVLVVFVLVLRRLPRRIAQRNPSVHKRRPRRHRRARRHRHGHHRPRRARRAHPADHRQRPARPRARGARQEHRQRHARRHPRVGHPRRDLGARRRGDRRREPDLHLGPHRRRTAARRPCRRRRTHRPTPAAAAHARSWPPRIRAPRTALADTEGESDAAAEAASTRQTWLLAGRTLSPRNRSILIEVLVRLLFHPAIIVSVFLLFVGPQRPRRRVRRRTAGRPRARGALPRGRAVRARRGGTRRRRHGCSAPGSCSPPAPRRRRCSSAARRSSRRGSRPRCR